MDQDKNIIIVDDFSSMRRIINNLLRDPGINNTAAADDEQTGLRRSNPGYLARV